MGSAANNITERMIERGLLRRYPTHRTLVVAVGWIERGAVASLVSYVQSPVICASGRTTS
jgi:hypothetical protein